MKNVKVGVRVARRFRNAEQAVCQATRGSSAVISSHDALAMVADTHPFTRRSEETREDKATAAAAVTPFAVAT